MSPYAAYRTHMIACPICGRGGPFCPTGLELGNEFERENRHLETLTSECWEPPLDITYPTPEEMDREFQKYDALPDDVRRL